MSEGIVRTDLNETGDTFKDGSPLTLPVVYGNVVSLPKNFGNVEPQADPTLNSNPVDWVPSSDHFGNEIT